MVNDFLCFDTESAQGRLRGHFTEELIELSVMNIFGETMFYHRFMPANLRRWDPSVHHITPDMVKNEPPVKKCQPQIQKLFDDTEYIVGFSLADDYKALTHAGIKNLERHKRVELRALYWYCIARHQDIPFFSGPGLSKCAETLGITVVKENVHTASGDTLVTLKLFLELMGLFLVSENVLAPDEPFDVKQFGINQFKGYVELALRRIDEAKYDYDRRCAAGYVHIVREDGGVKFISTLQAEYDSPDVVMSIPVNARRRAIYDLENMFARRRSRAMRRIFHLTESDYARIREYNNEFDGQEQLYQRLTGIRRAYDNV